MPDEFSQEKSIFQAAAAKPRDERAAFLGQVCAGNAELRRRVEDMLALAPHEQDGGSLNSSAYAETDNPALPPPPRTAGTTPAWAKAFGAPAVDQDANIPPSPQQPASQSIEKPGTCIGPYKLLQRIGEGGMGTVWMAEQTQPVKRLVAVKVIKPGMDSSQVLARFEAERQAIALMDHPHIAKVLDAGATDTGRPYFAMELVKGVPFTTYCDEHRLTPRERLELFVPVCQAVQHAHQKGIIHRDIKPSNVLVANYDGKPVPKVIDFGVAKATGQKLTERTMFTGFGGIVGTLEYMSPEQAEFNALDIDTRSDIYSLGVLLYELLTGTTPLTWQRVQKVALAETLWLIREEDPPRPSTRLGETKEALAAMAVRRKTDPVKLARLMRGELDWLVMKALEKDRNRRYETANSLALDIQRYLNDEPVLARPPSATYRLRKFAKRNKGALAAAAIVLLALVGGIIGTTLGLLEAQEQRDTAVNAERLAQLNEKKAREEELRANASAIKAKEEEFKAKDNAEKARQKEAEMRAVLEFFQNHVVAAGRPQGFNGGLGIDVKVSAAVDAAEPKIASAFMDKPLVEASIRNSLGLTYSYLGKNQQAIRQYELALKLRHALLGPEHIDTLETINNLAMVQLEMGQVQQALQVFQKSLKIYQTQLGPDDLTTLTCMNYLADAYQSADQLDKALPLYQHVLERRRARFGPDDPMTLNSVNYLGTAYLSAAKPAEAVPLFEEAIALASARFGPDHANLRYIRANLALAFKQTGRVLEAIPLYEQTVRDFKASQGAYHSDTLTAMNNLAQAYRVTGRLDDALPLFEETLKLRQAKHGSTNPGTLNSMSTLAEAYYVLKRYQDAEPLYRAAAEGTRKQLGLAHKLTQTRLSDLGECYEAMNLPAKAEPIWRELAGFWKEKSGTESPEYAASLASLGGNLLLQQKFMDAEAPLLACLTFRLKHFPDHWATFNSQAMLGASLLGQKKYVDAEPLLLAGCEGLRDRVDSIPPARLLLLTRAIEGLVRLYEATDQKDKAAKWQKGAFRGKKGVRYRCAKHPSGRPGNGT